MSILMRYLNETAKMTWSLLGWNTLKKQQNDLISIGVKHLKKTAKW